MAGDILSIDGIFLGALLAFIATSSGAALVLLTKSLSKRTYAAILSFSAAVMAFAAYEMFFQSNAISGDLWAILGFALGLLSFNLLDRFLPHVHTLLGGTDSLHHKKRKAALLAGTITIHNIPEGFAIASAFSASPELGWLVAISIAIQDFPEGLVVAAPLFAYGVKSKHSFMWGAFSGFVEFASALAGFAFLSAVGAATPFALAFSSAAMVYVTVFELLPDAFSNKDSRLLSGLALFIGLAGTFAASLLLSP